MLFEIFLLHQIISSLNLSSQAHCLLMI